MFYTLKPVKNLSLEKVYTKAMKELNGFFGMNWVVHRPRVIILKDRAQIDEFYDDKTPDWQVGWSEGQSVFALDHKKFGKESARVYSKDQYAALIKHELCHSFLAGFVGKSTQLPAWVSEGTCLYLASQLSRKRIPQNFTGFLDCFHSRKNSKSLYGESGYAVGLLLEKFGKQKYMKLLKGTIATKNRVEFDKLFKKIYQFAPTYKNFNELLAASILELTSK